MGRRPSRGGDQFVVALEQDAAFADRHAAPGQLLMDLWDAAMLAIAQGAGQRDHVEAELMLRQRQSAGFTRHQDRDISSPSLNSS